MPRNTAAAPGYLRELHQIDRRTLIKSSCQYCGQTMIESVPELTEMEWKHRVGCKKPRHARRECASR